MGFILIDFKKRDESKRLKELVKEAIKEHKEWFVNYNCDDDTPPNEDECAEIEDAKIAELMGSFASEAEKLWRVKDEVPEKAGHLQSTLNRKRGYLYRRFANAVEALEEQAAHILEHCVKSLEEKEAEIKKLMPMKESDVAEELQELMDEVTAAIDEYFPDGVTGLDAYDDALPEGVPSFAEFKESVTLKEEELVSLNSEAAAAQVEGIKNSVQEVAKERVNDAIKAAIADLKAELSGESLPYLDQSSMDELREEVGSALAEYEASRVGE